MLKWSRHVLGLPYLMWWYWAENCAGINAWRLRASSKSGLTRKYNPPPQTLRVLPRTLQVPMGIHSLIRCSILPFRCHQHSYINTGPGYWAKEITQTHQIELCSKLYVSIFFFFTFNDKIVKYLSGIKLQLIADLPQVASPTLLYNVILFHL